MDDNTKRDIKDLMDEFATMGRKFSRLAHAVSTSESKVVNRQFGKTVAAYQAFFGELKKLFKQIN